MVTPLLRILTKSYFFIIISILGLLRQGSDREKRTFDGPALLHDFRIEQSCCRCKPWGAGPADRPGCRVGERKMSPATNVMPGSVKLLSRGVVVLAAGEVNWMSRRIWVQPPILGADRLIPAFPCPSRPPKVRA
jgi:hypothetical protein